MIIFKHDSKAEDLPLTWRKLKLANGRISATIICPNKHYGALINHEILEDGTVQPSVVCPIQGCGFHDNIKLEGWDRDETQNTENFKSEKKQSSHANSYDKRMQQIKVFCTWVYKKRFRATPMI